MNNSNKKTAPALEEILSSSGTKVQEALETIEKCRADRGFYASAERYKYEYWTRDLYFSLDALLSLGYEKEIKNQIEEIWNGQKEDGELPRLISEKPIKRGLNKAYYKIKKNDLVNSVRSLSALETRLNRWTVDYVPMAVIATYEYAERTGDSSLITELKPKIDKTVSYVEEHMKDGLLIGGDWRDSVPELRDKALLSNNVILYKMYSHMGEEEKADALKERINNMFWNGEYYEDFPGSGSFDSLGASLAVLEGVVPKDRYTPVYDKLQGASRKSGVVNVLNDSAKTTGKQYAQSCNQRYAVWPFISLRAAQAMKKMGADEAAKNEIERFNKLDGFYEWYDPDSGKPQGSRYQLWSAAAYYSAFLSI